ncbi:heavy metal sensor histidine kinase [Neptunomonas phycophila]|uniref:heavy metal sensor histidine kinase n=1 Tax=Neptunomonas phycophila TaxID=1572645 RepID=UPI003514D802
MKRKLSLIWRLTGLYTLVSGFVLLGLSAVIIYSIKQHFVEQDKEILQGKVQLVSSIASDVIAANTLDEFSDKLKAGLIGHKDLLVLVMHEQGVPLYSFGSGEFPVNFIREKSSSISPHTIAWNAEGQSYRGIVVTQNVKAQPKRPIIILVALNINHHNIFMSRFQGTLLLYVVIAALISGFLGWLAAKRGLLPLYQMKSRALAVTANQLDKRMSVENVPVEISELASALNQMLERLEDAFRRLSEFSSDIAHELRTPVSNLMTQTHVALSLPRDVRTYQSILASNAEEYERLSRTISDMLFLAKADHGLTLPSNEIIELNKEVADLFEFYDALAEDHEIHLRSMGKGQIKGDRLMIRRVINNLLSNAIRYTPAHGTIEVQIESGSESVLLIVKNAGVPIPESDIPHLFERFYRVDKNRVKGDSEGSGLGLAITRAIVVAHNGDISVTSTMEGTIFRILFPKTD